MGSNVSFLQQPCWPSSWRCSSSSTAGGSLTGIVRIAVSGTHCSGKSTLIEDFVAVHRDYVYEPEPYEWLADLHGESFAEVPDVGDFHRQLEVCVGNATMTVA